MGLLGLLGLGAAGLLLWLVGALSSGGDQLLRVDFAHAGGVPSGAPVKLAGVQVGRVRSVELLPERRDAKGEPLPVQMSFTLRAEVLAALHADSRVVVAMQSALGEPYLELSAGSLNSPRLAAGTTLRGIDPPRIDQLIGKVDGLVNVFSGLLLGDSPGEARDLMKQAGELARAIERLMTEHQGELGPMVRDLASTLSDVAAMSKQARALLATGKAQALLDDAQLLTAGLKREVPALTGETQKTLTEAQRTLTQAQALLGPMTPADGESLKRTLERLDSLTARSERLLLKSESMLNEVEAGKGTIGGLYKDPELHKELKALVAELRSQPIRFLFKSSDKPAEKSPER